jgi:hypothetical protein
VRNNRKTQTLSLVLVACFKIKVEPWYVCSLLDSDTAATLYACGRCRLGDILDTQAMAAGMADVKLIGKILILLCFSIHPSIHSRLCIQFAVHPIVSPWFSHFTVLFRSVFLHYTNDTLIGYFCSCIVYWCCCFRRCGHHI